MLIFLSSLKDIFVGDFYVIFILRSEIFSQSNINKRKYNQNDLQSQCNLEWQITSNLYLFK